MNFKDEDFASIENKIEKAQERVQEKRENPSSSSKPLILKESPTASPIMNTVRRIINDEQPTYADIINFFANFEAPVRAEKISKRKSKAAPSDLDVTMAKMRRGGNMITALKKRDQMYDGTLFELCQCLGYKVIFEKKDDPDLRYEVPSGDWKENDDSSRGE